MGAPHLARFLRDVGYHDCLLTRAPAAADLSAEINEQIAKLSRNTQLLEGHGLSRAVTARNYSGL
jgi:hypothetical protein